MKEWTQTEADGLKLRRLGLVQAVRTERLRQWVVRLRLAERLRL